MRRRLRLARALAALPALVGALAALAHADERKDRAAIAPDPGSSAVVAAPSGDAIELAAVLEVAVRQSPTLDAATIDVEVARAEVLRASGLEDWLLSAGGSFARRREVAVEGEFATSRSDRWIGEVGLAKLLPTGGTLSIGGSLTRTETLFELGGMASESLKYTADVVTSLTQPLLRDFGSTATRAARSQAEHAERAADFARKATAQGLVRDLVAAYWEVAYAQADLAIRRSSLELAGQRRRLTEASVRLGQVAPTEIVAVDQIIAQREEEILGAEVVLAERSLDLRRLAGLEIGPRHIELAPSEPLTVEASAPNLEQVVEATIESSPELAALAARGRGAKLELEVSESGSLPRLDLALAVGPIGSAIEPGAAVSSMTGFDGYSASASLRYEQALGNRAAEGRSARARAEVRRVELDERSLRLELALAATRAVRVAESARRRIELSTKAISLSEKNVKAETGRFELGKSTNFDVLQRQEELKQARLRQARAVVDYLRGRAIIDALTGEILGKYGVTIGKP